MKTILASLAFLFLACVEGVPTAAPDDGGNAKVTPAKPACYRTPTPGNAADSVLVCPEIPPPPPPGR